jgi:tetratricopeptide (TPR) repeat protein
MADSTQVPVKLLTAWLLLLAGPTAFLRSQEGDRASKIYADSSKSVFLLLVKSDAGQIVAQGTGFVVADGKIVTNEHVVREGHVYIDLGAAKLPTTVEQVDAFNDLAVLTASAELSAKPLVLASGLPAPGAAVYAIGNPAGLERSISTGVVSGIRKFDGRELIQVTTPISPGSSGGPIFNSRGEVVGVAVGILQEGQNLNFAVPATLIQKLLRGEVATNSDVPTLLEKAEALKSARNQHEYSQEPDSDWQKIDRQIDSTLQSAIEQAGNDGNLLLSIAKEATDQNTDLAISAAERALRSSPSVDGNLILAKVLNVKGFFANDAEKQPLFDRAEKAARTALRLSKKPTPEVCYQLADVLEDRTSYAEAEENFHRAFDLSKPEGDTQIHVNSIRGMIRTTYSLGKPNESDIWFKALVNTGKANAWDWQNQGSRLDKLEKYHEAGQSYQQAALLGGAWTNWCEAAWSFLSASTDDSDLVLSVARRCISEGTGKADSEQRLSRAHRQIASILNDRGVYQEALSHAREATVIDPSDAWAFDNQAVALMGLRRFQEAINASTQAIRLSDGKFAGMHFHLGSAYFEVENWEFARQSYEKVAELNPKSDASAYNVALCFQHLRLYLDSAHWYEEVLRRNPDRTDKADILKSISILRQ